MPNPRGKWWHTVLAVLAVGLAYLALRKLKVDEAMYLRRLKTLTREREKLNREADNYSKELSKGKAEIWMALAEVEKRRKALDTVTQSTAAAAVSLGDKTDLYTAKLKEMGLL